MTTTEIKQRECPLCGSPSDTGFVHSWCADAEQAWADRAPPFNALDPEKGDARDTSVAYPGVKPCTRCGGLRFGVFAGPSGRVLRCRDCAQRVAS